MEKQREREMKKAREDMYEEKNKVTCFKKNISHEWLFRWQRCTRRKRRDWKGQSSV